MDVTIIPDPEFKRQAKRLAKKYHSLKEDLVVLHNELRTNPYIGANIHIDSIR